jgi:hypothetical protein
VLRLLVTANVVPSSPILVTLTFLRSVGSYKPHTTSRRQLMYSQIECQQISHIKYITSNYYVHILFETFLWSSIARSMICDAVLYTCYYPSCNYLGSLMLCSGTVEQDRKIRHDSFNPHLCAVSLKAIQYIWQLLPLLHTANCKTSKLALAPPPPVTGTSDVLFMISAFILQTKLANETV